jgi:hypothetical protein
MPGNFIAPQAAIIAFIAWILITASLHFRIAIHQLLIFAVKRHSHAIVLAIHRGEIADED